METDKIPQPSVLPADELLARIKVVCERYYQATVKLPNTAINGEYLSNLERRIRETESEIKAYIENGVDDDIALRKMKCKVGFLTSELAAFNLQRYRE